MMAVVAQLRIGPSLDKTLRRQLYDCISEAILAGDLKAGLRIPSTRLVSSELGVSRNTVAESFAQLIADGFLVARRGSGTFVAPRPPRRPAVQTDTLWTRASKRGRLLAERSMSDGVNGYAPIPFQPGVPAFEHFPFETWSRIASRIMRRPNPEMLGYGRSTGYAPLQNAVANELRSRLGIVCREEQIIIVSGTAQALDLVCRLVLDPGDSVWLEDPSSTSVRRSLTAAGADIVAVPVDADGIDVERGKLLAPNARLAHVTSGHQWPTGLTLSLERRRLLLEWARSTDAWIVEDEYDGVFRYASSPAPDALRVLDEDDRVLLIGSFGLRTFPALRLGYLVSPPTLVDAFAAAKSVTDRQSSQFEQAILAEFMSEGHFALYQRRMLAVYSDRQRRLIDRIHQLTDIRIPAQDSGLHLVLPIARDFDDIAMSRAARDQGITAWPLSTHYLNTTVSKGLILGYGAGSNSALNAAIESLGTRVLRPRGARSARLSEDIPG